MSAFIVLAILFVLLLGGDRLAAIGRGVGDGIKGYRKARRDPPDSKPSLPAPAVVQSPPKQLPAKGESSPSNPPERND